MAEAAILFPSAAKPLEASGAWLARAAQARRVAMMLAAKDAEILEAYALECEAKAAPPAEAQAPAVAA
jgi:hypothetical protein